jgi:hypothetical protein
MNRMSKRTLKVQRETVRVLAASELASAAGAATGVACHLDETELACIIRDRGGELSRLFPQACTGTDDRSRLIIVDREVILP